MADGPTNARGEPADDLTPDEMRAIAEDISATYPPPRLGTELALLEVDPHRAHAYWNVDVEDYEAVVAENGLESPDMLLRLHDITSIEFTGGNAHSYFDLQVQGLQGHWYVDLWQDGRTYIAELGLRRKDGGFAAFARSNSVATPAANASANYNTQALDVLRQLPDGLRMTDLIQDPNLSPQNTDADTGAEVKLNPPPFRAPPPVPAAEPALTAAAAPATVSLEPSVVPTGEFPIPTFSEGAPARSVDVIFDAAKDAVTAEPPSPRIAPPKSDTDVRISEGQKSFGPWPSGEELARHAPDTSHEAPKEAPPPVEAAHPSPPAEEPAPASLPLENYVSLSSFENGRAKVDLEVNVELHIYGRAKPGAKLSFYGQPMKLQPDGTFSLRKPLPHGAVVVPILAVEPPAAE